MDFFRSASQMIVLKIHYCLWFGSLAGILPYVSVFGQKYSSASASEIGFLYTILPFIALLAKPIFCSLADKFVAHKQVLVFFIITTLIGFGCLIFAPWFGENSSWTWWYFSAFVLLANTSMGVGISMNDSIAMRGVSAGRCSFGAIRVFGTLGWGIFGLIAGYINDHDMTGLPYLLPGLVMFIVGICVDIMTMVLFFKQDTVSSSDNVQDVERETVHVWSDLVKCFVTFPSFCYYCLIVFMSGFLTAFHWSFFFWFLETIRPKDTLLMGLCLVVQSFGGEVPFFLCADWIVKKIGFDHSLSITFLSIAARYLCYGYLISSDSAYYVLIVELLQGPAYSLFYVVMTAIAEKYAQQTAALSQVPDLTRSLTDDTDCKTARNEHMVQKRTFATGQGVLSAVYEGAGLGVGALVAGQCIDRFGLSYTWIGAGFLSAAISAVNFLLTLRLIR